MIRFIIFSILLSTASIAATADEYLGTVKGFYVRNDGLVLVNISGATPPNCGNSAWPFAFALTDKAANQWVSMILMAKASNAKIGVAFTPNQAGWCVPIYFYFLD